MAKITKIFLSKFLSLLLFFKARESAFSTANSIKSKSRIIIFIIRIVHQRLSAIDWCWKIGFRPTMPKLLIWLNGLITFTRKKNANIFEKPFDFELSNLKSVLIDYYKNHMILTNRISVFKSNEPLLIWEFKSFYLSSWSLRKRTNVCTVLDAKIRT